MKYNWIFFVFMNKHNIRKSHSMQKSFTFSLQYDNTPAVLQNSKIQKKIMRFIGNFK